jgi:hypothetical protein
LWAVFEVSESLAVAGVDHASELEEVLAAIVEDAEADLQKYV